MELKEFKDALDGLKSEIVKLTEEKAQAVKDGAAKEAKEINEKIAELKEAKEAQQKHLDELTARQKDVKIAKETKSFDEVVSENLTKGMGSFNAKDRNASFNFDVKLFDTKAAATMTRANYSGGTVGLSSWDPEFARLVRRQPFLRQLVTVKPATSQYVAWAEQANRDGGAGQTAEGTAKTQADFDMVEANKKVEKITSYMKVSKEALSDISFLQSEINNELLELVALKLDADLLAGNGTTPAIKGILEYAPAFSVSSTGLFEVITRPNSFDVIRAAVWQIANTGLGAFMPNYVVVNPIDAAKWDMVKDTTGQYVIPPFATAGGQRIAGLTVIENTGVTAGDFLVGDFKRSNLALREDVNISVGYDADDFTKNLITILAEVRAAHYIKTNHVGAFVKGTFSTAITALDIANA